MTKRNTPDVLEPVAGNGLLHRRLFLSGGAAVGVIAGLTFMTARPCSSAAGCSRVDEVRRERRCAPTASGRHTRPACNEPSATRGRGGHRRLAYSARGARRHHHAEQRCISSAIITAYRYRSGTTSSADPRSRRAAAGSSAWTRSARYPMVSRIQFLECSGDSACQQQWPKLRSKRPRPCTDSSRAASGQACRSQSCSKRPVSNLRSKWLLAEGVDAGGDESQRADGESAGRRDSRALSERRARSPGARLSGATVPAGLRRQHERQMVAPHQGDGGADDDEGRNVEVLRLAAERPGRCCSRSRWKRNP